MEKIKNNVRMNESNEIINVTRGKRVLIRVSSVILAILLFLLGTAATTIYVIREITSQNTVNQLMESVDITSMLLNDRRSIEDQNSTSVNTEQIHNNDTFDQENDNTTNEPVNNNNPEEQQTDSSGEHNENNEDVDIGPVNENKSNVGNVENDNLSLAKWIYNITDDQIIEDYNITVDNIEIILEESTAPTFIAGKLNDYIDDLYTNSGAGKITNDEVINLVRENAHIIYEATGYSLSDEDYDKINNALEKEGILESFSLQSMENNIEINLNAIRWTLSYYLMAVILFVFILISICIYIINRRTLRVTTLYIGLSLLSVAVMFTTVGIYLSSIIGNFRSNIPLDERMLNLLVKYTKEVCVEAGIALLILSVILSGFPLILHKIKQNKRNGLFVN